VTQDVPTARDAYEDQFPTETLVDKVHGGFYGFGTRVLSPRAQLHAFTSTRKFRLFLERVVLDLLGSYVDCHCTDSARTTENKPA
jgi:hypothetical protein